MSKKNFSITRLLIILLLYFPGYVNGYESVELEHKSKCLISKKIYRYSKDIMDVISVLYFYWPRYTSIDIFDGGHDQIKKMFVRLKNDGLVNISGEDGHIYATLTKGAFDFVDEQKEWEQEKLCFVNAYVEELIQVNNNYFLSDKSIIYESIPRIITKEYDNVECGHNILRNITKYLGYLVSVKKDYKRAKILYESINISEGYDAKDLISLYNIASSMYHWLGKIDNAIELQKEIEVLLNKEIDSPELIRSKIYQSFFYCSIMNFKKAKELFNIILLPTLNSKEISNIYNKVLFMELKSDIFKSNRLFDSSYKSIIDAIELSKKLKVKSAEESYLFLSTYLLYIKKWILEIETNNIVNTNFESKRHLDKLIQLGVDRGHRFIFMTKIIIMTTSSEIPKREEIEEIDRMIREWYFLNTDLAEIYEAYILLAKVSLRARDIDLSKRFFIRSYEISKNLSADEDVRDYVLIELIKLMKENGEIKGIIDIIDKNPSLIFKTYKIL